MLKFFSLGSGSSGNCYFLTNGQHSILIDAGLNMRTLRHTLQEKGYELDQIDAVFITHDHADHIKAVGHLANEMDKPIYATQAVHLGINRNYCVNPKLTPKHTHYINKGETLDFHGFSITPFDVIHDSSDCVGYRVEAEGITFVLITDSGTVTETLMEYVKQANYLILESNHDEDMLAMGPYPAYLKGRIRNGHGHMSNKEAAILLAENATEKLRHVWLCHLSEENNHPELARKTVSTKLREYGIIAGVDFQVTVLGRKTPSELYELT